MANGNNNGTLKIRIISEYGWLSDGSMLYSSGGVSRVMPSMIPSLSVCSSSITSSGVPVDATETTASVTGYAVCSEMILIFNKFFFHIPHHYIPCITYLSVNNWLCFSCFSIDKVLLAWNATLLHIINRL